MRNSADAPPGLTKRIDLNLGPSCNLKCRFCYYIKDVKRDIRAKDLLNSACKRLIRYYYRHGMEVLEFTGGEPTIRNDLFELAEYARQTGFKKISIITNGIKLADAGYARELAACGAGDFLFSVHGSTAQIHDYATCVRGSFKSLLRAIENLQKMNAAVRCNSVVTGTNIRDIYARAELFMSLGIDTVNFIMFNPIEQAECSEGANYFKYSDAAPHLKKVIDDTRGFFKKITIRYMPLCVMPGYENYIQNVQQVHYDHDEWDYYLRARVREPYWKWIGGVITGFMLLPRKKLWLKWGMDHARHAAIMEAHTILHKTKLGPCKNCAYRFICGGVWKKYARRYGGSELKTVEGPLVLEPWHFMTDNQRAENYC